MIVSKQVTCVPVGDSHPMSVLVSVSDDARENETSIGFDNRMIEMIDTLIDSSIRVEYEE